MGDGRLDSSVMDPEERLYGDTILIKFDAHREVKVEIGIGKHRPFDKISESAGWGVAVSNFLGPDGCDLSSRSTGRRQAKGLRDPRLRPRFPPSSKLFRYLGGFAPGRGMMVNLRWPFDLLASAFDPLASATDVCVSGLVHTD